MEVVGLTISAIAFVDQAIQSGSTLARIFRDCGDAGKQVYNATQRLEAQKYTLELWRKSWQAKARKRQQQHASLEDGFRQLWGKDGYDIIIQSLAQLNLRFGEAFQVLRSIDPDSFGTEASKKTALDESPFLPRDSQSKASAKDKRNPSPSSANAAGRGRLTAPDPSTDDQGQTKKRWYRRLSPSDPHAIWRRKSVSSMITEPATAEEQAELGQQVLQQKLSPGTKFKWSVSQKEKIRDLVNDVDHWLALLQTLATQCEAERNTDKGQNGINPSSIRAAAKALYTALREVPSGHDLDFKLEKERADSGYFEQVVGPLDYLDRSGQSFKFPLLVSSSQGGAKPVLLLAEAMFSSALAEPTPPLDKATSLGDIVKTLESSALGSPDAQRSLLFRSHHTTIVIHAISGLVVPLPTMREAISRCTFAELLRAETAVPPLVALWKRLQLACIIAISVLHLYETGWISERLETSDFHFFGSPDSHYHERNRMSPYISAAASKGDQKTTPFDCLKRNQVPSNLLGSRDERLATLFHRLGIVLFELGRGVQHRDIFGEAAPTEGEVLAEIGKIQFGRLYRDLVKACLTGNLYTASEINIDTEFNRVVVEKLTKLERHFRAILYGDID